MSDTQDRDAHEYINKTREWSAAKSELMRHRHTMDSIRDRLRQLEGKMQLRRAASPSPIEEGDSTYDEIHRARLKLTFLADQECELREAVELADALRVVAYERMKAELSYE